MLFVGTAGVSLVDTQAGANTLSAIGGLDFGRSSGMNELKTQPPLLGAEYMLDLARRVQFGGFYLQNFLSYKSGESGTIGAAGVQVRFHIIASHFGPFADAQIGLARRTQGQNSSGSFVSVGGGAGYEIPLGMRLSLSPHAGVRMLPDSISGSVNKPVVDGSVLFSVHL
jgi:hypothetical protein